ncbi:hypothetical protein FRC03_003689 [Tulasnella sp. 419]|nr:hypothetical protein FRC02_009469 [Tulasnella sp. 418]KAG8942055.1 hypothetical protein FRC03_003689 [Tulasnella sp. 419]
MSTTTSLILTSTTAVSSSSSPSSTAASNDQPTGSRSFQSKVVLTATIGGILILSCSALWLCFKCSRYIRARRQKARRRDVMENKSIHNRRKGRNAWDIQETEGIPA